MRSPFRYPGGKTRKHVQEKILRRIPARFGEYREGFVGGGGIFFAIPTDRVEKRWINDLNDPLIAVYKALRDRPEEFIASCREIEPAKEGEPTVKSKETSKEGSKEYNARLKAVFDQFVDDEDMDAALRYFYLNRTIWGGRVTYDPAQRSRLYFSNPQGWNIIKTDLLEKVAAHLVDTRITCDSYEVTLSEPGDDVVVYLDPPYVVNSELARNSQLYELGFSMEDHEKFRDAVVASDHKVCISYDDHELVRDLFREDDGFYLYTETWKYSGTGKEVKDDGQELIITNYDASDVMKTMYGSMNGRIVGRGSMDCFADL